jgi:hypothetical protein
MFLIFIVKVYFATIPNVALISSNEYRTLVTVYLDMVDSLTEWTARFEHRIIHILVSASFKCLEQAHKKNLQFLVMSITIVLLLWMFVFYKVLCIYFQMVMAVFVYIYHQSFVVQHDYSIDVLLDQVSFLFKQFIL